MYSDYTNLTRFLFRSGLSPCESSVLVGLYGIRTAYLALCTLLKGYIVVVKKIEKKGSDEKNKRRGQTISKKSDGRTDVAEQSSPR